MGDTSYDVTIQINQDGIVEGDETFGLVVQNSPNDPVSTSLASSTFTIHDSDTPINPSPGITWTSTPDDHYFVGTSGNDSATGNSGDNTLIGNGRYDTLSGGAGNDILLDSGGNNTLLGGDGNDSIQVTGPGTNVIDGGAGVDTLYFSRPDLTDAVTVNVVADGDGSTYEFSLPDGTTVSNVELLNLTTGSGDDQVTFANTTIAGWQYWYGGAGSDTAIVDFSAFSSAVNANTYYSGYVVETQSDGNGGYKYGVYLDSVENVTIYGGSGNDNLSTGSGNDTLSGGAGNDTLTDTGGNNTLLGGDGNDNLYVSGPGVDTIDGGAGTDTLSLYRPDLTSAATANNSAFTLPDGTSVTNIELLNLTTGSGDDQASFVVPTIDGTQTFDGGAGNDTGTIDFSAFSSAVSASYQSGYYIAGAQWSNGSPTNAVYLYNVENVTVYGGSGNDSLSGGAGNDILSGGAGDDQLIDNGGNNTLKGGDGNDYVQVTGSGTNVIDGGAGNDTLYGGSGNDTAVYHGNRDDFTVTQNADGSHSIADVRAGAPEGVDTVSGIEFFQFADRTLSAIQIFNQALPTVTESLIADTGSSSTDNITANPALTGSADPNATVTIKEGSTTLGTTTADGSGVWTLTPTLPDGAHTLVASETDLAGNTGTASLTFTLDATTPTVSSGLALSVTSDSGIQGDMIMVTGIGAAGDTVALRDTSDASAALVFTIQTATPNRVIFFGSSGADHSTGGAGNDIFHFSAANLAATDTVNGGLGTDELLMTSAGRIAAGGVSGVETFQLAGGAANTLTLSNANFTNVSGATIHVLGGAAGSTVNAAGLTGTNRVIAVGGAGADHFTGGAGNDLFSFSVAHLSNSDTIKGGGGSDTLSMATAGTIHAGSISGVETFQLAGGAANILTLTSTNFTGVGGHIITVNEGNSGNTISAATLPPTDKIMVHAGTGADTLKGGAGNDIYYAGGKTTMTGGAGANRFTFAHIGTNGITDFGASTSNKIVMRDSGFNLGIDEGLGTGSPQHLAGSVFVANSTGVFT